MKNNKPVIRFKGFSEEWEERKLLDNVEKVIDFRGRTPKKLGLDWSDTGYLALSALNVKNGYIDPFIDAHYGGQELYDKWMAGNELHKSQVLFTTEAPMGNVAQIPDEKRYILSQRTIAFNVNDSLITEDFLAAILGSPKIFLKLSSLSSGGTAKGVSQKSLATVDLWLSKSIQEQTQIGNFFKNLDNLISLHQRKYDKLGILKKAMLEKMFPKNGANVPEIRFKGFEGAWEERKLGEILTEMRRSIALEDTQTYELVTVKRRNQGVVSRGLMKGKDILVKSYFEVRQGDYIISKRQVIHGANGIVPENLDRAIVSNEYLVCVENENITAEYLTIISNLPDMYKKFFLSSYGVDIEKLVFDVEDWKKRSIVIPSLTEQKRITGYFKHLDDLLRLHQGELAKLKNLKKALLEKMFV